VAGAGAFRLAARNKTAPTLLPEWNVMRFNQNNNRP